MKSENSAKVTLNSQFVKDLSFENPHAPASIPKIAQNPQINFNVDINAKKLKDDYYEVIISITAKAMESENPDQVIFITELNYAGIFTVTGTADESELKKCLLVDCPTLIFPFARRIIADATRDGGFPPLIMEPIDFSKMLEKKAEAPAGDNTLN